MYSRTLFELFLQMCYIIQYFEISLAVMKLDIFRKLMTNLKVYKRYIKCTKLKL